jgi:hypothetical protein
MNETGKSGHGLDSRTGESEAKPMLPQETDAPEEPGVTLEELQAALSDPARRDQIRRLYGSEPSPGEATCQVPLEDAPDQRKLAIFNSW